jgi:hypothetical protein
MEKEEALQKLQDMPLADRIAPVAAGVDSKQDEFRSIDAHELAIDFQTWGTQHDGN